MPWGADNLALQSCIQQHFCAVHGLSCTACSQWVCCCCMQHISPTLDWYVCFDYVQWVYLFCLLASCHAFGVEADSPLLNKPACAVKLLTRGQQHCPCAASARCWAALHACSKGNFILRTALHARLCEKASPCTRWRGNLLTWHAVPPGVLWSLVCYVYADGWVRMASHLHRQIVGRAALLVGVWHSSKVFRPDRHCGREEGSWVGLRSLDEICPVGGQVLLFLPSSPALKAARHRQHVRQRGVCLQGVSRAGYYRRQYPSACTIVPAASVAELEAGLCSTAWLHVALRDSRTAQEPG